MRSIPILFPALLLASCVGYRPDHSDPASVAERAAMRPGGALTVDEAIALALRDNPELRAVEAEARAAGAETTVPLQLTGEYRGRNDAVGLMVDPIALLGLGPRGGAIDVARAAHAQALAALAVARWSTIASVAETFAVDAALAELEMADLDLDVAAFERAGLASAVAVTGLRAAQAQARCEGIELARAVADTRTRLGTLLGLVTTVPVEPVRIEDDWLQQPQGTPGELLERPDLRLAAVAFERADAELRKAVADQYPSFRIGPSLSLRGDPLDAMALLQIPLGMHGLARAAQERRQAARDRLEAAFLRAQEQAALADRQLEAAEAAATATHTTLRASRFAFDSARTALEVEPDAFTPFARSAEEFVRATSAHRRAVTALARARVQRARAWGWPRAGTYGPDAGSRAGGEVER